MSLLSQLICDIRTERERLKSVEAKVLKANEMSGLLALREHLVLFSELEEKEKSLRQNIERLCSEEAKQRGDNTEQNLHASLDRIEVERQSNEEALKEAQENVIFLSAAIESEATSRRFAAESVNVLNGFIRTLQCETLELSQGSLPQLCNRIASLQQQLTTVNSTGEGEGGQTQHGLLRDKGARLQQVTTTTLIWKS